MGRAEALEHPAPKGVHPMSFKPEVIADSSSKWCGNALCFATREEAETNVRDLMMRWFALRETRVVESDDPVNIRYVDGRLESLTSEAAALAQWVSTPLDCVSGGVLRSALERSFVAVLGDREINRQNFPLSRGMTSFDR